jgi:hypothetical protein
MKKPSAIKLLLCCLFLSCASLGRAPQFRFAWVSDTHIGSPNAAADLEAAVRDINALPDTRIFSLWKVLLRRPTW